MKSAPVSRLVPGKSGGYAYSGEAVKSCFFAHEEPCSGGKRGSSLEQKTHPITAECWLSYGIG